MLTFPIQTLTKSALIEACRRLGIKTGDTARNDKDYYVNAISSADPAAVEAVVNALGIVRPVYSCAAPVAVPAAAPALIGAVPAAKTLAEQPEVVDRKSAKDLFGIDLKLLDGSRVMCDVWNDPDAPEADPTFRFNRDTLGPVLAALNGATNCWLAGPKGTGKTELVIQIAARLGRALCRVNFDASTEKYEFLGGERVRGGSTVWQDGAVLLGMRRAGCIILLDEIARARPEYLIAMNPLLEPRGKVTITETGETFVKAPGVVFIAADNSNGTGDPSGNYVCRKLDASLIDRFGFTIEVGYPAPEVEAGIVCDRTGCHPELSAELVKFVRVCRTSAEAGNLEDAPGLRNLFAFADAILAGIPVKTAFEVSVVNKAGIDSREELFQLFRQNIDPVRVIAAAKGELALFDADVAAKADAAKQAAVAAAEAAAPADPFANDIAY
jgi:MoxR-like ATPase